MLTRSSILRIASLLVSLAGCAPPLGPADSFADDADVVSTLVAPPAVGVRRDDPVGTVVDATGSSGSPGTGAGGAPATIDDDKSDLTGVGSGGAGGASSGTDTAISFSEVLKASVVEVTWNGAGGH